MEKVIQKVKQESTDQAPLNQLAVSSSPLVPFILL